MNEQPFQYWMRNVIKLHTITSKYLKTFYMFMLNQG